jgi:hypothetical protein
MEAAARIRKVNDPVGAEHAVSLAQAALGQHGEGSVDVHDGERQDGAFADSVPLVRIADHKCLFFPTCLPDCVHIVYIRIARMGIIDLRDGVKQVLFTVIGQGGRNFCQH